LITPNREPFSKKVKGFSMRTSLKSGQIAASDWKNNGGIIGYKYDFDPNISPNKWILPMIVDVDITLKFIESKSTVYNSLYEHGNTLYDYLNPIVPTTP
jgi:hypothetical protein